MQIELSETGDLAHHAAILAPLAAHNAAMTGRDDPGCGLSVLLRDASGAVEGGMLGSLWQNWFKLDLAYLPPHRRGARLGARMLSSLEAAAVAKGAVGCWTQSFSFQAPGFYERLGYRRVGVLADRPPGFSDVFLAKTEGFAQDGAELVVTDAASAADLHAVRTALRRFSDDFAGPGSWSKLALLVRGEAGAIEGGLWASLGRQWMFVDLLGLPAPLRRERLGTRLMDMAEDAARARGCIGVYLDTFSFQARPFYEKRGYAKFAEIDGYPGGHQRFFLSKRL